MSETGYMPAFPVQDASKWQAHGLTMRDYFAAKALQGLLTKEKWEESGADMFARDAYTVADAMIAARDAKP